MSEEQYLSPLESRIRWIKQLINKGELNSIDSSEFEIIRTVYAEGSFGLIELHHWKNENRNVILKHTAEILDKENDTYKHLIRELKVYKEIYDTKKEIDDVKRKGANNVIRFYGVSYFTIDKTYKLVLEYATQGDLRKYMRKDGEKIDWSEKIKIVRQILNGLYFLHSNEILHRDLHTKNILIQQSEPKEIRVLIADYGFSKVLSRGSLSVSQEQFGKVAFVDPCVLSEVSMHNKTSDIYSFGVVMWEISNNGKEPFEGQNRIALLRQIAGMKGYREKPILGTPKSYVCIYQECWQDEPSDRPTVEQLERKLNNIDLNNKWTDESSLESDYFSVKTINSSTDEPDIVSRNITPPDNILNEDGTNGKEKLEELVNWLRQTSLDDPDLMNVYSAWQSSQNRLGGQ